MKASTRQTSPNPLDLNHRTTPGVRPRALLLGRVSTIDRHRSPTGRISRQDVENQLLPLRDAARRLGWQVVGEIPIPGLSAWSDQEAAEVRRRIFEPFERGEGDVLMVWSLDRVVRGGIEDAFRFLRHLEGDLGVDFWSLQEPFLNTTSDRQQRELMISLLSWVSKWESQRKSERLRAKASANRNRAEAGGGRASWGRGSMATKADVALMRELRSSGKTLREIASKLNLSLGSVSNHLRSPREVQ